VTKSDLVDELSQQMGLSHNMSGKVVNRVFALIADALKKGEDVRVTGFGTFRSVETKERTGRNPRTGEEIQIPASRRVVFSAGSGLLELVRGTEEKHEGQQAA
jgi:DNA-binding protein HU-beta